MALAKLSIDLTAKIASFEQELKRSTQLAEQQSNKMAAALGLAGKALGAFGAGLSIAGIANYVRSTADLQREMLQLSRVAGTTTEVFSGMAFGAQRFNISSEKLADILKDTQDKLGDFLQNGAGPLKDFFDNIAPQIGLTAEEFRNLSGPDVLQKYYNALRQTNLTQAETVFYLEALASDATNLIPLLEDNGRGFADAAREAKNFGLVVSQDAAKAALEFDKNVRELTGRLQGLGQILATPLIERINILVGALNRGVDRGGVASLAADVVRLNNDLKALESRRGNTFINQEALEENIRQTKGRLDQAKKVFLDAKRDFDRQAFVVTEVGLENDPRRGRGFVAPVPATPRTPNSGASTPAARTSEAQLYLQSLQRQLEASQSLTAQETLLRDIGLGRLGALTEAQRVELQNTAAQIDARREQTALDAEQLAIIQTRRQAHIDEAQALDQKNARWQSLLESMVSETTEAKTKRLIEQVKVLDEAMLMGMLSTKQWEEALKTLLERQREASSGAGELKMTFSSAFEDAVVKGGKVSDMLQGLVEDIGRIALRKAITEPLGNSLGGLFSNIFSGIFGGPRAAGGPVNYGKAYLVGEKGPEIFMPQGNGNIVPNNRLGGQMVYSPVFNFNGPADQALVITAAQMGAAMGRQAVYDDMARGRLS